MANPTALSPFATWLNNAVRDSSSLVIIYGGDGGAKSENLISLEWFMELVVGFLDGG